MPRVMVEAPCAFLIPLWHNHKQLSASCESRGDCTMLWEILCSSNRVTVSVYIVRVFSSIEHQVFFIRTSRCNTPKMRNAKTRDAQVTAPKLPNASCGTQWQAAMASHDEELRCRTVMPNKEQRVALQQSMMLRSHDGVRIYDDVRNSDNAWRRTTPRRPISKDAKPTSASAPSHQLVYQSGPFRSR